MKNTTQRNTRRTGGRDTSALANYNTAATRAEQLAQLDNLISAWADTAEFGTLQQRAAANDEVFDVRKRG